MLISRKIFELIKQRGMTQKEFSELTEISQSTISDWKRKKTNPSADKILKICEVLRVTPQELLSETDGSAASFEAGQDLCLSEDEHTVIELFRELEAKQKQRALGYLEALANRK